MEKRHLTSLKVLCRLDSLEGVYMQVDRANNSVVVEALSNKYKLRFDDVITEPSFYRFELEALAQAQAGDEVSAVINSDGGSLASGIEIANAIFDCKAEVEGILRSSCHSCGSIIFLACHKHDVGLSSEMLLHSGSGGNYGTPQQQIQRAESYKRQVKSLFDSVYKGFLSDEELDKMLNEDKEYIFCGEEIVARLQNMYTYRKEQVENYQQGVEDELWEENTKVIDETLETLDIPQEDKDNFIKVRDHLDRILSSVGVPEELQGNRDSPTSAEASIEFEGDRDNYKVVYNASGLKEGYVRISKGERLFETLNGDVIPLYADRISDSKRTALYSILNAIYPETEFSRFDNDILRAKFIYIMDEILDGGE